MKKLLLLLMIAGLTNVIFADRAKAIASQKEILELAKKRHAIQSDNLEQREQMIAAMEASPDAKGKDLKAKLQPFHDKLKANKAEIQKINESIKAKRKELRAMMQASKKKKEPVEDLTPQDGE